MIESERLLLRPHRPEDFDASHAMWSDPRVVEHITGVPSTRQQSWTRLLTGIGHWSVRPFGPLVVEEKSSGAFVMIVWIFIIVAHFAMRRREKRAPRDPQAFRAWFYPVSNWIALLTLVAVLGSQAFNPDSRFQFWFTVLTALAIVAAYFLRRKPAQLGDTAGARVR